MCLISITVRPLARSPDVAYTCMQRALDSAISSIGILWRCTAGRYKLIGHTAAHCTLYCYTDLLHSFSKLQSSFIINAGCIKALSLSLTVLLPTALAPEVMQSPPSVRLSVFTVTFEPVTLTFCVCTVNNHTCSSPGINGQGQRSKLQLGLGSQFETRSVGP